VILKTSKLFYQPATFVAMFLGHWICQRDLEFLTAEGILPMMVD
jgi:hypothetical protein